MGDTVLASVMEENLKRVWNERDSAIRLKAIEKLYASDSGLFHVGHQTYGHEATNNSVTGVLKQMPEDFVFHLLKPVVINNDIGRLIWGIGPAGKPPVQTGMDIAVFRNQKIQALYVFLD
ncbi:MULTISPECIES: nuclear transport factor 2 family protein [Sinomicrobium]|uniref:nuclear transport factor 2 family protein n=1 Tax=Sinomicrobium TaxID=1434045 RepID=UPI000DCB0293|nr:MULTISPECIES: nuclear transport factor 2 family protein [Sinomicrobium]RAV29013.1 nuclear transport factor 2 family protein [Sinomicrobium sp. N-1-3-6]